ncbi:MAG: AAA family ATPase [Candidatus Nanoarchaeia archaeon]|nr:AAA family ATPase [Candidatus Nanoarchaeia archaeon]
MIITICGDLGSGKSTVAKILASKLDFKRKSVGDFMGELALKRGLSLNELGEIAKHDGGEIDAILDEEQRKLKTSKENIIFDSRLGWFFVPDSFKVYLKVDINVATERIFKDHREDEKENVSLEETKKNIILRTNNNLERWDNHYKCGRYDDPKHFDLIIDTTNISAEEVAEKIIEKLRI